MKRREFLKSAAVGAVTMGASRGVSIIVSPDDKIASAGPPQWAVKELQQALIARGIPVRLLESTAQAAPDDLCIVAAGADAPVARDVLKSAGVSVPAAPEALGLIPGKRVLLACGHDARGLMYGLLELADRVQHAADPLATLAVRRPIIEQPANKVRSLARLFCSDVEDKPWFNDREMWPRYFTMLAAQRFNRFNLSVGIGYDFLRNVTDAYFLFAYPFLVAVPGYNVRAAGLPDSERDANLAMLKFISQQAAARGLDFQLGLWTHGYQWIDSPHPNYTIEGLTPGTHGRYCRDALQLLLKECPAITGVTFRVHGESGVAEGSYDFWKTVFDGVARCGRPVEIDMHAKGIDQKMIDIALATGLPVKVGPKYWAEHMGMPYHQAAIRELEMPPRDRGDEGFFALSGGSRKFLRYGYGDLLREDRRYGVIHRIWPGTQRLLLWGDPAMAAGYGRAFSFCGSAGFELMEPLSFKGRRGSGIAGDRGAYVDPALRPRWDWEKHAYALRLWGRLTYNPDADPDTWRRYTTAHFRTAAPALEAALANASRMLPTVTTAHGASAANNSYWPEVYTNQPIVDAKRPHPFSDTPAPRVFGNVSPFDPQLFSRINDFADELIKGQRSGKHSPAEVAQWLEDWANAAAKNLAVAESRASGKTDPPFRRASIDIAIASGLGRFFAWKLRSGVLYAVHERTGDRAALEEALKAYRAARKEWAALANRAKGVYASDITVGEQKHLRGHWLDRLPAIDADIADMAKRLEAAKPGAADPQLIREVLNPRPRPVIACRHAPAPNFRPGQPLEIALSVEKAVTVRMYYRRVNQSERYQEIAMEPRGNRHTAVIAGSYTDSPFPLQYYFELRDAPDRAWLYPGLAGNFANQPYFVIRRHRT